MSTMWTVESAEKSHPPVLPERVYKLGSTIAEWFFSEPGVAVIRTLGGSVDDRFLAETIVREQLAACGIRQARFTIAQQEQLFDPSEYGRSLPEVINVDGDPEYAYEEGRPWIYHPQSDKLYVGQPEWLHWDLIFNHPDLDATYVQQGGPPQHNDYTHGRLRGNENQFYHRDYAHLGGPKLTPDQEERINAALAAQTREEYGDDMWHDSRVANGGESGEDQFTWTPGQYGKGILTQDGVLHAWGVGSYNDGDPIHSDYQRAQGIEDGHTRFWLHRNGDVNLYTLPRFVNHEPEEVMHYVRQHVPESQYKGRGYPDAEKMLNDEGWDSEPEPSSRWSKTSHWNDIMAKAKRLVQSGNVQLLRNGANIIVAHVIGDHGEYTCEISRDDPNSQAITQWTCECPWDQYAFQRTRKWKKYEGRPCAHVLAAYWKSLGTPLDEQSQPGQEPVPTATSPEAPMGNGGIATPDGGFQPSPSPEGFDQPFPPAPSMGPQAVPMQAPGQLPPVGLPQGPQGAPMPPGFAPPADNAIIPPYPMDPAMYQLPVSVPGGRPGPYPANPIQQGGTFSKTLVGTYMAGAKDEFIPNTRARLEEATLGKTVGREGATDAGQWYEIPKGSNVEVVYQDPATGWVEVHFPLKGGPMTSYHVECFVEPAKLTPLMGDSPMAPRRRL